MPSHPLSDGDVPAVRQVVGDACGPEAVGTKFAAEPREFSLELDHPPDPLPVEPPLAEHEAPPPKASKQRLLPLRLAVNASLVEVGLHELHRLVVGRDAIELPALLREPEERLRAIHLKVPHVHPGDGPDPGKSVDHGADDGAVPKALQGRGVDGTQELIRLLPVEDGRFAFQVRDPRPLHRAGRIEIHHPLHDEVVKEHADGCQVLLDGGGAFYFAEALDVERDGHGLDAFNLEALEFRPVEEAHDGVEVGGAGVLVADAGGEELQELLRGVLSGLEDEGGELEGALLQGAGIAAGEIRHGRCCPGERCEESRESREDIQVILAHLAVHKRSYAT